MGNVEEGGRGVILTLQLQNVGAYVIIFYNMNKMTCKKEFSGVGFNTSSL